MKKVIVLIALIWGLAVPQVWGGMSDLEEVGTSVGKKTEMGRFINSTNNIKCADYRATVASLKADIADTTNTKLLSEVGIKNGISISAELTDEMRALMLATEVFCKGADAAAKMLPANN